MDPWFHWFLVVVGTILSVSALTPEECQPLVKPQTLHTSTVNYGRFHLIAAYINGDFFSAMLMATESSWMNFTRSPDGAEEVVMYEMKRIHGNCIGSTSKINVSDNTTASATFGTINSSFQVLPSSGGHLVLKSDSTATGLHQFGGLDQLGSLDQLGGLEQLGRLELGRMAQEVSFQAIYLMARNTSVSDSDLQHFQDQASCLGFSGKPHYVYEQHHTFCEEGEGAHVIL